MGFRPKSFPDAQLAMLAQPFHSQHLHMFTSMPNTVSHAARPSHLAPWPTAQPTSSSRRCHHTETKSDSMLLP
jgi:hypothetical protein